MSAPNAGRQSPDPSHQSDAQSGSAANKVAGQGGGPSEGAEKSSDKTKTGLPSNPKHVLDDHAKEVTSKTEK